MITNSEQPIIAIPDLHGQLKHAEALYSFIRKQGLLNDHRLVFLGDYLDRGPQSKELIDFCIQLQSEGHIFLAGNHEYVLNKVLNSPPQTCLYWLSRWLRNYECQMLEGYGLDYRDLVDQKTPEAAISLLDKAIPASHSDFLFQLPLFYEDPKHIFVHAGILPNVPWENQRDQFSDVPPQLFSRSLAFSVNMFTNKRVVSGHTLLVNPIVTPLRVLLNCGVESYGPLIAWLSDTDQLIRVQFPNPVLPVPGFIFLDFDYRSLAKP